jgi:hypothetical protein
MHPMLRKTIAQFLAGLMVYITVAPAFAGLVGTQSLLNDSGAAPQRALIRSLLQRAEARDILADYGVSQEWAVERVDRMTEEEVRQVATQIDHLPAGGDILVLFLLVFLILIVLEAVGVIDLFTFM